MTYTPNPEAIEYLEGEEYKIKLLTITYAPHGQYRRNLFDVLPDAVCDNGCRCYIYPEMPLASVSEEDALKQWEEGNGSILLPKHIEDKYWQMHWESRDETPERW